MFLLSNTYMAFSISINTVYVVRVNISAYTSTINIHISSSVIGICHSIISFIICSSTIGISNSISG